MDEVRKAEARISLLMKESDQLHQNIQRCMAEIGKIVGIVYPLVTGVFLAIIQGKLIQDIPHDQLFSVYCVLVSLLLLAFNSTWIQLTSFTCYKYAEIMPYLYKETGREGENYGQYTINGRVTRSMIGAVFVQAIFVPTMAYSLFQIPRGGGQYLFVLGFVLMSLASCLHSWVYVHKSAVKVIKASNTEDGSKEHS